MFDGGLVLLRRDGCAPAAGGLLEPIAVAVHGEDADVVSEAVEQRADQALRSQDRGNDGRAALEALREGLKQQVGTLRSG